MTYRTTGRILSVVALLTTLGLATACESDVDRQMREEREALKKSGEMEELEKQLHTTNPDPYDPKNTGTRNIGRHRKN